MTRRAALRLGTAAAVGGLAACSAASDGAAGGSGPATRSAASSSAASSPTASSPSAAAWGQLRRHLSGDLLLPGASGWDAPVLAGLVANPRFARPSTGRQPDAVARCTSEQDLASCAAFAAEHGLALRVRSGGHSYSGASSGPGLVADVGPLDDVVVDGAARTASVGAGAVLARVYAAVAARGLALGAGSCPTVGVSGLTLGGGVGVLARSFGLTCDQVRSARVASRTGAVREASAHEEADLFWALRGGGAGVAPVTRWTFALRPAPPVTTFTLRWDWSLAEQVLLAWQQWLPGTPRELWSGVRLLVDPAGASGADRRALVVGTWTGEAGALDARLAGLLGALPAPAARSVAPGSYAAAMLAEAGCTGTDTATCVARAADPTRRQPFAATTSVLAGPLPGAGAAAAVAAVAASAEVAGLVEGGMSFDALGGAVADVDAAGTAFPWRSALATVQHTATWGAPAAAADPSGYDDQVHAQRRALQPWCGTSAYVNYADAALLAGPGAARDCWGANAARLARIKGAS